MIHRSEGVWWIRCEAEWSAAPHVCQQVRGMFPTKGECCDFAVEVGWRNVGGKWACPRHMQALKETP